MNKKIAILFSSISLLALPAVIFAFDASQPQPATTAFNIGAIIGNIINIVAWPVFIGVCILIFIYIGFLFLTANGDPGKVATAQKAVLWAIIGIIVAIVAFSIVSLIQNIITAPAANPAGADVAANGACCMGDQTCSDITSAACTTAGGAFNAGSTCAETTCALNTSPATGACCYDVARIGGQYCLVSTRASCISGNGVNPTTLYPNGINNATYIGDNEPCPAGTNTTPTSNPCP